MHKTIAAALLISAVAAIPAQAAEPQDPKAVLTALDAKQKDMVARGDLIGLAALSAPGLTINAPTGRVLTRERFLAMMANGQIGAEAFERQVESVTVAGDVGIVMGSEIFTPTPQSELGRTYGARPLKRRYTNVYQRQGGVWKWLARHANVVSDRPSIL